MAAANCALISLTSSASFSANLFLAGLALSSSSLQMGQVFMVDKAAQAEHSRWNRRHPKIGGVASVRQTDRRLAKCCFMFRVSTALTKV